MGVYTKISHDEVKKIVALYVNDDVERFDGIEQGIQNTIYKVKTTSKTLILTLYERERDAEVLLTTNRFVTFLGQKGIPTAPMLETPDGSLLLEIEGKLASLSPFLSGANKDLHEITVKDCRSVGAVLAQMHSLATSFPETKENPINPEGIYNLLKETKKGVIPLDIFEDALLIREQWDGFETPKAIIHADLFPDNTLLHNNQVSGVLDFNFCYHDYIFYDLAICLTAWCFDEKNVFQKDRFDAFLSGYSTVFPLADVLKYLDKFLIAACFRFSMSRLHDLHLGQTLREGQPHDPQIYIDRYLFFCEHGKTLTHDK